MSHSVSQHLRIQVGAYDRAIRRFIPGYDEMLDRAVAAVVSRSPLATAIEIGAGTGSLSARLLERAAGVSVELWDVDEAMLDQARARLSPYGDRARFVLRSFAEPLPPCDAVMASLALHHLRAAEAKTACYTSIAAGLAPGGVLVNADATIPANPEAARAAYRQWADHLVASGIDEPDAWRHFEDWALEDRYFSIEEELGFLRDAGLVPQVDWQLGPSTVIVAVRPE
jgi:tRNA (cmo5U34)-methyltransferase